MRIEETYEIVCANCAGSIEVSAAGADQRNRAVCSRCGQELALEWREGRAAIAATDSQEGRRREAV